MATTNVMNGRLMRLTLAGEKVIHSTSCSISTSTEVRDTASKDIPEGWADGESGQKSWTGSCEGLYSQDDTFNTEARADAEALFDLTSVGDKIAIEFLTGVDGDVKYVGSAVITSLEFSFPNHYHRLTHPLPRSLRIMG